MATPRFEAFVRERMDDLVKAKREALQKKYDDEVEKVAKTLKKYQDMAAKGARKLLDAIVAKAAEDGHAVDKEKVEEAWGSVGGHVRRALDAVFPDLHEYSEFEGCAWTMRWPDGTPAEEARKARRDFDAKVEKAVRKLVVYKMDLGLKPEKFEEMLAAAAKELV